MQQERFSRVREIIESHGITVERFSLGNSGALEQKACLEYSHIRPGLMLYGATSLAPQHGFLGAYEGKIISTLRTKVLNTFSVKKGDPIGYGSVPASEDGIVAVIALGYGDGLSTRYKGAKFYHNGAEGVVCARVCMDMTHVLFPEGTKIERGESFTIWDEDRDHFMQIAKDTNTLPYELIIQLTSRVPRIYQLD